MDERPIKDPPPAGDENPLVRAPRADEPRQLRPTTESPQRQFDVKMRAALHDVCVPLGLERQIRLRLAVQAPAEVGSVLASPTASPQVPHPRRWLLALAAVAAGTLLFVTQWAWRSPAIELDPRSVAADGIRSAERLGDNIQWHLDQNGGDVNYPSSKLVAGNLVRHAQLATPWDEHARVYQYRAGAGRQLYCFVARVAGEMTGLGRLPPHQPLISTGGWNAACWQEGECLYVLVVQGETTDYQRAVRPGRQFAMHSLQSARFFIL